MRPRMFDHETAERLLQVYSAVYVAERQKQHKLGYGFNQFFAAACVIEMAQSGWKRHGNWIVSSPDDLAKLASAWQLDVEEATDLAQIVRSLSPEALVQHIKRWRTRFARGKNSSAQVHNSILPNKA